MNEFKRQLTLDRPAIYQIKVPGQLDESWIECGVKMKISVAGEGGGPLIATLTGAFDQAALQGLLRQLYGLGRPLISVICVDSG